MFLNKSLLADAAILLALLLLGLVSYKLPPLLLPQSDVTIEPNPACDPARTACALSLPEGGRMSFSFSPLPVPVAAPFEVRVGFDGIQAKSVTIDFTGVGMAMGLNRFQLTGDGASFFASASLPVCVTGRMEWQATVIAETSRQRIAVPFRFFVGQ